MNKFTRSLFASILVGVMLFYADMVSARVRVAAVYANHIEQQWTSRIHDALERAKYDGRIDYTFAENAPYDSFKRVMARYIEQGAQLVVAEARADERGLRDFAVKNPGVAFLFASSQPPIPPNVSVFDTHIHEAAYLVGLYAGEFTKTGKIGIVAGYPIPEVNRYVNAFMLGVKETRPDAKITVDFMDSWYNPKLAREKAKAMIAAGVDLLYAERFGVASAAYEMGVFAVGNLSDTQAAYPGTMVASAVWLVDPTITAALKDYERKDWGARDYRQFSYLRNGGTRAVESRSFTDVTPPSLTALVQRRASEIVSGKRVVPVIDTKPN